MQYKSFSSYDDDDDDDDDDNNNNNNNSIYSINFSFTLIVNFT